MFCEVNDSIGLKIRKCFDKLACFNSHTLISDGTLSIGSVLVVNRY